MNTRGSKMENGGWNTRSVLECGGPPPLSDRAAFREVFQSARGLAQSKSWRLCAAENAMLKEELAELKALVTRLAAKVNGGGQ